MENLGAFVIEFFQQPGTSVGPHLIGLARRHAQDRGGVGVGEAREVAQFDQLGGLWVDGRKFGQGFIEGEQFVRLFGGGDVFAFADADAAAAVFDPTLPAGVLDEDASHRLGGGGEKMSSPLQG